MCRTKSYQRWTNEWKYIRTTFCLIFIFISCYYETFICSGVTTTYEDQYNIPFIDEDVEMYEDSYQSTTNTSHVFKEKTVRQRPALPLPAIPTDDKNEYDEPQSQYETKASSSKASYNSSDIKYSRQEYSDMVKIIKPQLVENLQVHDILPHLPFLENHDDIYEEVKNRSRKSAVYLLLRELENSSEPGKLQLFIDALTACGYTYIVDTIRGYKFVRHQYQRKNIKRFTSKIINMIEPCELLPHLLGKDLLSDNDKENIQSLDRNNGHIAASVMLLERISQKHRDWYIKFIEALEDAKMDDVASLLKIPELMGRNRIKVHDCQNDEDVEYSLPPAPTNRKLGLCETSKPIIIQKCSSAYSLLPLPIPPPPIPPRVPVKQHATENHINTYTGYTLERELCDSYACLPPGSPTQGNRTEENKVNKEQKDENYTVDLTDETYEEVSSGFKGVTTSQGLGQCNINFDDNSNVSPVRHLPIPSPSQSQYTEEEHEKTKENLNETFDSDNMTLEMHDVCNSDSPAQVQHQNTRKYGSDSCTLDKSNFVVRSPKFKALIDEVEEMKKNQCDIDTEVSLLEQKFACYKQFNGGLRKIRELKKAITLQAKEKTILQSDLITKEDAENYADNTELYYPNAAQAGEEECRKVPSPTASISRIYARDNDSGVGFDVDFPGLACSQN